MVPTIENAPDLSRSRVKALIRDGRLTAGGETITDPSAPVKLDREYVLEVPPPVLAEPAAQNIALDVVFEDDHLIVIDKSPGMTVHPAPGSPDGTLVNALLSHCGDTLSGIGGVRRPGIVHRIDKDTSGLLVVAKTDDAHHSLVHQFAARTVTRSYRAVIWGTPIKQEGRIEGSIGRSRRNRKKMAVVQKGGKPAATQYSVIEYYGTLASLLECRLESGRTHQIRVHLSHVGHSLVGDALYGGGDQRRGARDDEIAAIKALGRQALHANSLAFTHPAHGKLVAFTSDMPADLAHLTRILSLRATAQ